MIINIFGIKENNERIVYQLPNVFLDRRFSYKVRCTHVHFDLANSPESLEIQRFELLALNSNLVDRSSLNPAQTLRHLWRASSSYQTQYSQLSDVPFFSLHLYELENATFEVIRVFKQKEVDLDNIFIQLEIIKADPYGRL